MISQIVLVLHPRHKLDYFIKAGWEEDWIERAKQLVRAEFERSYKPGISAVSYDSNTNTYICIDNSFYRRLIHL